MRLSEIRLSLEKEMREVWRDKRTLLITLALPALLFPVFDLFLALTANTVAEQGKTRITRVCFSDPKSAQPGNSWTDSKPDLLAELKGDFHSCRRIKLLALPREATPETAIVRRYCDVVVRVSPSFSSDVAACRLGHIDLYDNACSDYITDEQNAWEPIKKFADDQRAVRLASFKIPGNITKNIQVSIKSVESERSRSAYWSALLYTVMLMFAMSLSSMYPALDVITGERERGTLILLLTAPGDRRNYVCGKLLTVSAVTLLSAILTLISATLSISLFVSTTQDFAGSFRLLLPVANLLVSSVFLIPLSVAISSLAVLLSSYARTFQQGQSYFAPLILLSVVLCGLVLSCEGSAPFFINLVPVANLLLCMFRAIQGRFDLVEIAAALLSSALYLVLIVRVAVRILDREESLFGIKQAPGHRTAFAREAFILFAGCLAGFFYLTPILQALLPVWGLPVAQIISLALPALIIVRFLKLPPAKTLSLRAVSPWSVAGALLLAPLLSVLATLIAQWQSAIMPDSESYIKALQDYLMPKGANAWTAYLTIALAPAICEELLFRGAIQGLLRRTFSFTLLCAVVAVMFGIMHGSSYRFLPTAIMGFILSMLTEYTGSLLPAIVLHASNNALACLEAGKEVQLSPMLIAGAFSSACIGILALRHGAVKRDGQKLGGA